MVFINSLLLGIQKTVAFLGFKKYKAVPTGRAPFKAAFAAVILSGAGLL